MNNEQEQQDLPFERVLPFAFPVVDAALQTFLSMVFSQRNTPRTKVQWQQLSSGSSWHRLFTTNNEYIGGFKVWAVDSEQTLVSRDNSPQFTAHGGDLTIFLHVFADGLYLRQKDIEKLIDEEPAYVGKSQRYPPEMLANLINKLTAAKTERVRRGRQGFAEDEWAWEQVNTYKQPRDTVREEWERRLTMGRTLEDAGRSFRHAIDLNRKRRI